AIVAEAIDAIQGRHRVREVSAVPEIGGIAGQLARNKSGQPILAGSPQLMSLEIGSGRAEEVARFLQEHFQNSRIRATAAGDGSILVYGSPDDIADIRLLTRERATIRQTVASDVDSGSLVSWRLSGSGV